MKTLVCKICGVEKELSEFRGDRRTKLGVVKMCKACRNERIAQNGEQLRQRFRDVRRRAKKYGVTDTLTFEDYTDVFSGTKCSYCGVELTDSNRSVDHVYPLGEGFANCQLNIVHCCRVCNKTKGTRHVYDFYQSSEKFSNELFREFVRDFTERLIKRPISDEEVDIMIENFRKEAEEMRRAESEAKKAGA
jgi:predicted metal-binding transcription factor (methanogenesis marker protein 9)